MVVSWFQEVVNPCERAEHKRDSISGGFFTLTQGETRLSSVFATPSWHSLHGFTDRTVQQDRWFNETVPGEALLFFSSSCVISPVFMYHHCYGSAHQVMAAWQEGLLQLKLSGSVFPWGF